MLGHHFTKYDPSENSKTSFEKLLDAFMQLLTYTSGDVAEALSWLTELDKEYNLTDGEYGLGDFIPKKFDEISAMLLFFYRKGAKLNAEIARVFVFLRITLRLCG